MANNQNSGKPWTPDQVNELKKLAQENTPTRIMALKLQRTPSAIQKKAAAERISLKPTTRSPYDRA